MDNKLSELSKPVAHISAKVLRELLSGERVLGRVWRDGAEMESAKVKALYSQEYVSALLAEIERGNGYLDDVRYAKGCCENAIAVREKRIAELEAKLATPVRLSDTTHPRCRLQHADDVRAAGFTVEGDE